jgi:hypothetical protein
MKKRESKIVPISLVIILLVIVVLMGTVIMDNISSTGLASGIRLNTKFNEINSIKSKESSTGGNTAIARDGPTGLSTGNCEQRARTDRSIVLIRARDIINKVYVISSGGTANKYKTYCLIDNLVITQSYKKDRIIIDADYVKLDLNGKKISKRNNQPHNDIFIETGSGFRRGLILDGNDAKISDISNVISVNDAYGTFFEDITIQNLNIKNSNIAISTPRVDNLIISGNFLTDIRSGLEGNWKGRVEIKDNTIIIDPTNRNGWTSKTIALTGRYQNDLDYLRIKRNKITVSKPISSLGEVNSGIHIGNPQRLNPNADILISNNKIDGIYHPRVNLYPPYHSRYFRLHTFNPPTLVGIEIMINDWTYEPEQPRATINILNNEISGFTDQYKRAPSRGYPVNNDFIGIWADSGILNINNNQIYGDLENGIQLENDAIASGSDNSICVPQSPQSNVLDRTRNSNVGHFTPGYCDSVIR